MQEQAIDMVLTDYCMPEITGYDLLKAIKVPCRSLHLFFHIFVLTNLADSLICNPVISVDVFRR